MMRPKVFNRIGIFVGIEGVTGAAEVLFVPFVSNRNASGATVFDESKEQSARKAPGAETAVLRKPQ
jgi:hypothetical protein